MAATADPANFGPRPSSVAPHDGAAKVLPFHPRDILERATTLEGTDLGSLYSNLADFLAMSSNEETNLTTLTSRVAPAPVVRVPFLSTDVHDLDGLGTIAEHLFRSRAGVG